MLNPNQVASQGPGGFLNLDGGATDPYYAQKGGVPYASAADACSAVPVPARICRTVNVAGMEYWWLPTDVSDAGLVEKSSKLSIFQIPTGISSSNPYPLVAGALYYSDGAVYYVDTPVILIQEFSERRSDFQLVAGSHYYYKEKLDPAHPAKISPTVGDFYYDPITKKEYEALVAGSYLYDPTGITTSGTPSGMPQLVAAGYFKQYTGLATVDFVIDTVAASSRGYADIVRVNNTRSYYDDIQSLFAGTRSGDVMNLYMPIKATSANDGNAFVYMREGYAINIYGVPLQAPNGASDVITLDGKNKINGYHSLVSKFPDSLFGGWLIGTYNVPVDADIYDIDLLVGSNGGGFTLYGTGSVRYTGNISGAGNYGVLVARALAFSGKGVMDMGGLTNLFHVGSISSQASVTWEGDIFARDAASAMLYGGQLTLRNGILHGQQRSAGSEQLILQYGTADTMVVLENYIFLGTLGKTAIKAHTVILRAGSDVIGDIDCVNFIDERPKNSVPGGAPQWVAGRQYGGSLVFDLDYVYRVKSDIINSQTAPGSNPANYLLIGPNNSTPITNYVTTNTVQDIPYEKNFTAGNTGAGTSLRTKSDVLIGENANSSSLFFQDYSYAYGTFIGKGGDGQFGISNGGYKTQFRPDGSVVAVGDVHAPRFIGDVDISQFNDVPLAYNTLHKLAVAFATVMAGANGAIDTFIEVYNQFMADASVQAAIMNTLAGKANLNGGNAFTGVQSFADDLTITSPTQTALRVMSGTRTVILNILGMQVSMGSGSSANFFGNLDGTAVIQAVGGGITSQLVIDPSSKTATFKTGLDHVKVPTPVDPDDATTKDYVDVKIATGAGDTLTKFERIGSTLKITTDKSSHNLDLFERTYAPDTHMLVDREFDQVLNTGPWKTDGGDTTKWSTAGSKLSTNGTITQGLTQQYVMATAGPVTVTVKVDACTAGSVYLLPFGYSNQQMSPAISTTGTKTYVFNAPAGNNTFVIYGAGFNGSIDSCSLTMKGAMVQEAFPFATPVTYSQLSTLIGAGGLTPMRWYCLTDYQTVHTIPLTTELYSGPIEPLYIQADSVSSLAPQAYSQTYPRDIIYYTASNADPRLPGITKGLIYRRVDTQYSNDVCFDFRTVKFRRWKNATTNQYTEISQNSNGYADYTTFSEASYSAGLVNSNRISMIDPNIPVTARYNTVCLAGTFANNVIEGISQMLYNTVVGGSFSGNVVYGLVASNVIQSGGSMTNNYVGVSATIQGNTGVGTISNNTLNSSSQIVGNVLTNGSIVGNSLGDGRINNCTFVRSPLNFPALISSNTLTGNSAITGKNIACYVQYNVLENSSITLTTGTPVDQVTNNIFSTSQVTLTASCISSVFTICTAYALNTTHNLNTVLEGYLMANHSTLIPTGVKNGVTALSYVNGESTTVVAGSLLGMSFVDANYRYQFGFSSVDTNRTQYSWTRTQKKDSAAGTNIGTSAKYTASTAGQQTVPLGRAITQLISVITKEANTNYTKPVWESYCTVSGTDLIISADAGITGQQEILVKYQY